MLHGHRCQPGRSDDVSRRVDPLDPRLKVLVHPDAAATVNLDASLGQSEGLHVPGAPDRVEHDLGAEGLAVDNHDQAIGVTSDRVHLGFEHEPDSRARETLGEGS